MKKEKEIKIRVTAEEYDRLKKAAEKDNETLSNYIRLRINPDFTQFIIG